MQKEEVPLKVWGGQKVPWGRWEERVLTGEEKLYKGGVQRKMCHPRLYGPPEQWSKDQGDWKAHGQYGRAVYLKLRRSLEEVMRRITSWFTEYLTCDAKPWIICFVKTISLIFRKTLWDGYCPALLFLRCWAETESFCVLGNGPTTFFTFYFKSDSHQIARLTLKSFCSPSTSWTWCLPA